MAPAPARHPLHHDEVDTPARRRAIAAHPAGRARHLRPVTPARVEVGSPSSPAADTARHVATAADESGSMTTEYGLIVVVGATACSLVIKWATGGAIFELLGGVLNAARGLVGF